MRDYLASVGKKMTGESESYYVEFSDTVSAIFKPEDELWDSWGEVGAYLFSKRVELPYVPPTVLRELQWRTLWTGKRTGSLQYFIRSSRDTSELTPAMIRERVGEKIWSRLVALAYPLGQWDFYGGNLILDDSGTPALIDNAAIMDLLFFRYGNFPYIYKGSLNRRPPSRLATRIKEFPYDLTQHAEDPSLVSLRSLFREFVGEAAIQRWYRKLDTFPNRTLSFVIWENTLWLHWQKRGLKSLTVSTCEDRFIQKLLEQTPQQLSSFMPTGFTDAHFALIADRSRQLEKACTTLPDVAF